MSERERDKQSYIKTVREKEAEDRKRDIQTERKIVNQTDGMTNKLRLGKINSQTGSCRGRQMDENTAGKTDRQRCIHLLADKQKDSYI